MKQMRKRLGALFLALAFVISLFSGHTGIVPIDKSVVTETWAASGTVSLSRILTKCGISSIGRPASEGLWCIRVDGKKTFCLNSGKTMNSGDHASGKTHDAATYGNQSLAKVLTYYFGVKEQKGGTKVFLLCQAYVWACGKGVSKKTAMIQAGKNIGVSATEASRVYQEIQHTDPYGKITYYSVTRCARGKNGASHQHLLSWSGSPGKASYGSYSQPYTLTDTEEIRIVITKKDADSGKGLAGARYDLYRDDQKIAEVTTAADGTASYTYTAAYTTEVPASTVYTWVKNWNLLSASRQAEEKQKGYYSSEAKAIAACISDAKPKAEAALAAQKSAVHIWKAVETGAPENHLPAEQNTQTRTEGAQTEDISFSFVNQPAKMTLALTKKSSGDSGVESTLKDAVYGLFAAETIYDTDNRTVRYKADDPVRTLITDAEGKATAGDLLPGRYYLLEQTAPRGFVKDTKRHSVDLSYTAGGVTVKSVTVTDTPVKNRVRIHKTFAGEARPTALVTEKRLREDYVPGLCEHHTEHDGACGYVEAAEGSACKKEVTEAGSAHDGTYGDTEAAQEKEDEGPNTDGTPDEDNEHGDTETAESSTGGEELSEGGHVHDSECGYREAVEGQPCTYFCDTCAYETVTVEREIPVTDAFALVDARGNTSSAFSIGDDGYGESGLVPYGTYTLCQTASTEGYGMVPKQTVTISDSTRTIELSLDDPRDEIRVCLTKYRVISDEETAVFVKEGEQGARFSLYDPEGRLVKTAEADERGIVDFGELKTFGTYTIRQVSGDTDYAKMPDKTVKVTEKKQYYVEHEDTYAGTKVRIQKYMEKDEKVPEQGAEFVVLDAASVKETGDALAAMTEEERLDYVFELQQENREAVIAAMTTDGRGKAAALLTPWKEKEHPEGFLILQTCGEKGYALADPVYSADMTAETEDGVRVYTFTATDTWDDWANVTLTKHMTISASEHVPEAGAVFRIMDGSENTVDTQTADEKGTVVFERLPFGTYRIEQVSGDASHERMDPATITLTEKDKHRTVSLWDGPLVDQEKPVAFTLTKKSKETSIILEGAQYALYRISDVSEDMPEEKRTLVTVLTAGNGAYGLPYGTYLLKEIYPADGYTLDAQEYRFTLTKDTVDCDAEGNAACGMELYDEPIKGTIAINKKGNLLTGFSRESESFICETGAVQGAEYGLYAKEDILRDDGKVMYAAGTLIDKKITDDEGTLSFTRTDEKGQTTDRFYLGSYYVKEIGAPAGYVLDDTEYEVRLTWDNKTDQFEDIRKEESIRDVEAPVGNNSPDPDAGKYILTTGEKLNALLRAREAASVTFTWEKAPAGTALISVSSDGSSGIVLWNEGKDCYISTQQTGQVIYMNAVSSHMFANCTALSKIRFKNIDTSQAVDMSYMFYRCTGLTALDLSDFNVKKAENVSGMFAYCPKLATVHVNDQVLTREETYEEDIPSRITAEPKGEFTVGHTYMLDDFDFTMYYANGKSEEIYPTETEAKISPGTADEAGDKTVRFSFAGTGRYGEFGTIESRVTVVDPGDILVERSFHEPEVTLQLTDEQQSVTIQLVKTDAKDGEERMLEGAQFTLYAACDIVDVRGNTLFKKDEAIASQISGDTNFSYVEFSHLPSQAYKKDSSAPYMYYVKETKAPEGYYGNDKVIYISGRTGDSTKEEFVYGYTGVKSTDADSVFTGSDDFLYRNAKIPYVILKKEWINDTASERPDQVSVVVTLPDGTKKQYTLKASENWTLITDLDAGLFAGYSTEKIKALFTEQVPRGYTESQSSWNAAENTYVFRNIPDHSVTATVEKVWDDHNNYDGIRPDHVEVTLYGNDVPVKTVTLPTDSGAWTCTVKNLPAADAFGNPYTYTWKETVTETVNGDAQKGYLAVAETDREDGTRTVLTNVHEVEILDASVKVNKKIRKENLSFAVDNPAFVFTLEGTDIYGDEQHFAKEITFTPEDMAAVDADGYVTKSVVFEKVPLGTYTVSETGMESIYEQIELTGVTEGVIKNNGVFQVTVGPSAAENGQKSADTSPKDGDQEMTFENGAVKGSVILRKYGEDGRKALAGAAFSLENEDGSVCLTAVTDAGGQAAFENLQPGKYTVTETATANGYTLLANPIEIQIPLAAAEQEVLDKKLDVSRAAKYKENYYFYDLTYEITNHASLQLPMTGFFARWTDYLWIAAAVALVVLGGSAFRKKRRP